MREKQVFWDECDRLGIMAWQEFPLACAFFDHYPRDRGYLETLAAEARGAARLLRHHPSLIAWCGGNEINPARERLPLQAIARVLADEDPDRLFIPASPAEGDIHFWDVWHGFAPWSRLATVRAPFLSEFGLQSLPDATTVAEMFPETLAPPLADPSWRARKAQIAKLRHYAGPAAATDLPSAIAATQRSQATALQVGIEACRLRRDTCGGVAFWQFNEPWPAVSWSVIDHAGRPKAAYEMLRRSFQPLLLAATFPWRRYGPGDTFQATIWLVNDGPQSGSERRAEAFLDGQLIWAQDGVAVAPAAARPIATLIQTLAAPPQRLELRLIYGGAVLTANRYDLAVYLPGPQPIRGRLTRWLADRLIGP